ncbi:hypothetical protein TGDOM2_265280 [Toxoplasma gondii GAB2-2007-GAL-DOM2]|uniref:Rhodanese domain-containing protein n=6 Tax=Toxoplasma gondii TaxID=5811 RepID=S7UI14_TOXGG|nr:hypothetical protein TGGT1_265280 [Toxoplasma gondii GT1]KAF4644226.1 hypothetical protein TGRH88_012180 [Toxoplasma gondii]KFG38565.1 hypothetical protein TGDOM2_265280 [Toxoplasma gondii GAB2-2007-GAL-DOM2]KFG42133.1 hypothetical protein TGFOU_265280 [Toxoplasma gondii FOU]KFH01446.1 hypothetical protein TGVAND_265280 [Toxoplasma gondii VAND]RQX74016.1 hypothetical protein TGCAST_265280 [Toxoplasma gondii CAST]
MSTPEALDFQAMLAEARREAAERRQRQMELSCSNAAACAEPTFSCHEQRQAEPPGQVPQSAVPCQCRGGLRAVNSIDFFNLLQAPACCESSGFECEPGASDREAQVAAPRRSVLVVDLRAESAYRVSHVRQAVHGAAFLRDLQAAKRQRAGQTCPWSGVSLPENLVFHASSDEENEVFWSFSQSGGAEAAAASPLRASGVAGKTETRKDGDSLQEESEAKRHLEAILAELADLCGNPGSEEDALPGEGTRDGLQKHRRNDKSANPHLFWLDCGFRAFRNAFPFLCLSSEDEAAAAVKMNATAAAALMSYPRQIFRRSAQVSRHPSQSSTLEASHPSADSHPDSCVSPVQAVYLGSPLHALSRGIRRRLRITTILDFSAEGLPAACGVCSCHTCPASRCKTQSTGSASQDGTRRGAAGLPEESEALARTRGAARETPTGSAAAEKLGHSASHVEKEAEAREEQVTSLRVVRAWDLRETSESSEPQENVCSRLLRKAGSVASSAVESSLCLEFFVEVIRGGLGKEPLHEAEGVRSLAAASPELPVAGTAAFPDERKAEETGGSVLVVHSNDVRSVSGCSAALAAFLASEKVARDRCGSVKTVLQLTTGGDKASVALARLMRRWPATRLESQHLRQLHRFCERLGGTGGDTKKRQVVSGGLLVDVSGGVSRRGALEESPTRREKTGGEELAEESQCVRSGEDRAFGAVEREAPEESSLDLRDAAMKMTLNLCRLPADPVFLVPEISQVSASSLPDGGAEDALSACGTASLVALLWDLESVFNKQRGPRQESSKWKEHVRTFSDSATNEEQTARRETQLLAGGLAALLSQIHQKTWSRSGASRQASGALSYSEDAAPADPRIGRVVLRSLAEVERSVKKRLLQLAPSEAREETEDAVEAESLWSSPWELLANCVGCWAARVVGKTGAEESEKEKELQGAEDSKRPAVRLPAKGAPVSSVEKAAVFQGLHQLLEMSFERLRVADRESESSAVGAYLLNLTLLKNALERPTEERDIGDFSEQRRLEEVGKPGNQVSKREADERKRLKKLLVAFLVQVVGREAAAFLALHSEGVPDSSQSRTSRLGRSESGHTANSMRFANEPEERQETFLGRPTSGICLALTALYGAFIKPMFLDAFHSAPATRDKACSGRHKNNKADKSKKRLKELFKTESMCFVLQVAEMWSAMHPTEGFEALQMLKRCLSNDTEDNEQCDENGFPPSLGIILRPIVLIANEIEGTE